MACGNLIMMKNNENEKWACQKEPFEARPTLAI